MTSTESYTRNPKVLVFDSGVGGLSIVRAIKQQHPCIDIIYASDNAAFPYGTKSEVILIERTTHVLEQIQRQNHADIIVIACNTASTVALPVLRKVFKVPVIGVVPAIKPAALLSESKVIGLLATPGTIARAYTHELIQDFAQGCKVVTIGSEQLVTLAENKLQGMEPDADELGSIVNDFSADDKIDTVVLACTHFPLLIKELQTVLPNIEHWVDSGDAIARRVTYWLAELNFQAHSASPGKHSCVFTQKTTSTERLQKVLTSEQLDNVQFISLPFL